MKRLLYACWFRLWWYTFFDEPPNRTFQQHMRRYDQRQENFGRKHTNMFLAWWQIIAGIIGCFLFGLGIGHTQGHISASIEDNREREKQECSHS